MGVELGVWEQALEPIGDGKSETVYQVTDTGEQIYLAGRHAGLRKLYRTRRQIDGAVEQAEHAVLDALSDESDPRDLMDHWGFVADWVNQQEIEGTIDGYTRFKE